MLDVFRRNQRVAVAVLGVVAMLSFVILPLVTQYFQSQSTAARGDVQQIRLAGRPLERDALARFQRNHSLTVQFLERIAMLVLSRNGAPKVPGFAADARGFRLGIETPDERNLETYAIRTFLLNEEARRMGLELDDQSVEEWLNLYFDNNVTQKEVADLLRELAQSQFGKNQLYSQLKLELQADLVMRAANLGLAGRSYNFPGGPITITPPAAAWKNYLKLNENATVAVYPFLVDDYIAETPETFPENEIAATFGKYKDRLAFSDSPEPGFRRRFASDLEVVTASFDDFFEKAKAEVTEEQLKAEYEKRVAEGRFDVKETTPPASTPPAETPPADKPAETTPPAEKPADMPAEKPAETPPARSQRKHLRQINRRNASC